MHNLRGDGASVEEDELGVARGAMFDAETGQVQTGGRRIAAFVTAIPLYLVCTGLERRVHQRAHPLAVDVVDGHVDEGGLMEAEDEVGGGVEGIGPHLKRGCRYHCGNFGR